MPSNDEQALEALVDQQCVPLLPAAVARDFELLPIGGQMPICDTFRDECANLKLLCLKDLSESERENLKFLVPRCSFTFVTPSHREFPRYKRVVDDFWTFFDRLYPTNDTALVASE